MRAGTFSVVPVADFQGQHSERAQICLHWLKGEKFRHRLSSRQEQLFRLRDRDETKNACMAFFSSWDVNRPAGDAVVSDLNKGQCYR
ncbi:hypothetical protein BG55_07385 [Erwinia mallotivora]|uniref:Uncharacterized protein n=1 Tax=Erwinia mallotivora TaxID=69222 RepID=A0A014MDG9_9GAMM|nr:hypothetical protein BG55_07385 [Erwinia mallotivora]